MSRDWSLFLDTLRLFAAIIVVHSHIVSGSMVTLEHTLEFGREAVVIFFVMSGYVIAYTSDKKHEGWRDYLSARVARITSIAYPTLALSFIVAALGIKFSPDMYTDVYQMDGFWKYLIAHMAFLGETSLMTEKPPLNDPYWSLSYEVWYYVLFAVVFYSRGWSRWMLAIPAAILMGLKLLLLLPVWWAGVYLYKSKAKPKNNMYWIGAIASISAIVSLKILGIDTYLRELAPSSMELGSADRFLWDYVVTVFVFALLYCVRSIDLSILNNHRVSIRKYANYTFSLYLTHNIVLKVFERILGHESASWLQIFVLISVMILVAHLVMTLGDKIKPIINVYTLKLFNGMKT
tara:strand:+ start:5465 stop:6508 length:1044 start_codon:yes stop_codon:yes gene_type:complete